MDACCLLLCAVVALILAKLAWELSEMGRASTELMHWPGPPRSFGFGNSHQLGSGPQMLKNFMKWMGKHGSPTRISFGPFHAVHIHRADHMEAALRSTTNTTKSSDYKFVEEWLGRGLLTANGDLWFSRRRILTPAFHFAILKDFVPTINTQTRILVDILRKKAKTEETTDVVPLITAATLDIICETAMGRTLGAQTSTVEADYVAALRDYGEALMVRMMRPWCWPRLGFRLFQSQHYHKYYAAIQVMNSFTNKVIAERIAERKAAATASADAKEADAESSADPFAGKKKQRKAFLDLLLDLLDEGKLSRLNVREETETFMFEGHDTTGHGIMWTLYALGRNLDCQRRAREEIQTVIGDDEEILPEQLGKLSYFEQCLKEAHRRWAPVPFVMRHITEPLKLDALHTVPTGSTLYLNFLRLHMDPQQWPEPIKYDPERFAPENATGRHPFAYAPFSAGVRNCIGQKFAYLEEKIVLVSLLRAFEFEAVTAEDKIEPAFGMVLIPTKGIHLKITPIS